MVPPLDGGTYCAVRDILGIGDVILVVRFTRHWIHYGFLAHTVVCVVIAAFEGLMGQ